MTNQTEILDHVLDLTKMCLKSKPVIVLGSGASIPYGIPGMSELANHLVEKVDVENYTKSDQRNWQRFKAEVENTDLEAALDAVTLSEELTNKVVSEVWSHINLHDSNFFKENLVNRYRVPHTSLFNYLFSSTCTEVSVITTNYDRLVEYSTNDEDWIQYKGFSYGNVQHRISGKQRLIVRKGNQKLRTVRICKVHGCLDWFKNENHEIIAVSNSREIPEGYTPAIVTPGSRKYEHAHTEPFRSILTEADEALTSTDSYLCIGFGFNDLHLTPKLREKLKKGAQLVIIAKTLSENVKKMLDEDAENYLALEESKSGTNIWSGKYPKGVIIKNKELWNFYELLKLITN